jgi:hypothetical protein
MRCLLLYDSDEAGIGKRLFGQFPSASGRIFPEGDRSFPIIRTRMNLSKAEGSEAFEKRLLAGRNGFLFRWMRPGKEFDMQDPQGQTDF